MPARWASNHENPLAVLESGGDDSRGAAPNARWPGLARPQASCSPSTARGDDWVYFRCSEIAAQANAHPPEGHILTTALDGVRERRIHAIEFVLLPPFGLLVFGCASIWVAGGFD
jgi:hypothetical protein